MAQSLSQTKPQRIGRESFSLDSAWFALSMLLVWMFALYWSDAFINEFAEQSGLLQIRSQWLAIETFTLFVSCVALRSRPSARLFSGMIAPCLAATTMAIGTSLILFNPTAAISSAPRLIGVVLTGIGCALLITSYGIRLSSRGPSGILLNIAVALGAASVADMGLLLLPDTLARMITAILPALSLMPYFLSTIKNSAEQINKADRLLEPASIEHNAVFGRWTMKHTLPLAMLPLVVGTAYGIMQRLSESAYTINGIHTDISTALSILLSGIILLISSIFIDSKKLMKAVCLFAIPLIGIAFVALPAFGDSRESAQSICIIGFNSFYFMIWALWANNNSSSTFHLQFALGQMVLSGSEAIGLSFGSHIANISENSLDTLPIICLVVVYVLLMYSIFVFARSEKNDGAEEHGVMKEDGAEVEDLSGTRNFSSIATSKHKEKSGTKPICSSNRPIEEPSSPCIERLARLYRLSVREKEVLGLLALGRNRAAISEELVLSENTVRTHMKNIYRKLGIHSQQALIDLVCESRNDA